MYSGDVLVEGHFLCCVSNDLKFCLKCDRFLVTVKCFEMVCHVNRVLAGRGVALNRNVRTEGISGMEVGGARWTLMLIPAKIVPWNLSMIFLPCL